MIILRRPARRIGLLVAALALLISACSSATDPAPAAPTAGADDSVAAEPALAFQGTTLDGAPFDAATLAGTPVVLWFWAPWCTICRAEGPDVATAAADYEGRVTFLGVAGLGEVADMQEFVADTGTGVMTHVVDADGSLWQRFGVVAQPAFAFIDAGGEVRTFGGSLDPQSLRQATDDLVAG